MPLLQDPLPTFWNAFQRQQRVLLAVVLRNMRTRFFGHGLGYLLAVGWPVSHILLLIIIFSFAGRAAPFGDSTVLFLATGAVPFMAFSYLSRFMMIALLSTKPLLAFPEVKTLDVLIGSAILEILSAFAVVVVMVLLAWAFGIPFWPQDVIEAFCAMFAAILLGMGLGVLNGVIVMAFPMWMTGYSLLMIGIWAASGVMFVPSSLPEPARTLLSYNPALQIVEWMRGAYYEGYGEHLLSRTYTIGFGIVSLALGLVLERVMRGSILSGR